MNEMSSNRARSKAVRSAAQAHLLALREERIAKRRAARAQAAPVEPDKEPQEAEPAFDAEAPPSSDEDDIAAIVPDGTAPEADTDEVEEDVCTEAEPEPEPAPETGDSDDGPNEDADVHEADMAVEQEPAVAVTAQEVEDLPEGDTDLGQLPGIGPGLIWMLQSAGIATLAEMAEADAAQLAAKLGLVGELLDLEHWIAAAAELKSAPT